VCETQRYERGLEVMESIQGADAAAGIRDSFDEISPDFGRYVVEAGFADVYGRPGLTLAQRQLLNVGVLTAIGGAEPQLAVHLRGALNVGVTPREIVEAVFHVALYAGHPRTVNGLRVVKEVFAERGIDPRQAAHEPASRES
jgi:4-carboxymuconolactone decarboxylase